MPRRRRSLLARALRAARALGPGLITGASDDDPSGVATYAQVGAQFGVGLLWATVATIPLMVAVQEAAARIGRVTGGGIAQNLRQRFPRWALHLVVVPLLVANTLNLGADIGAMGAVLKGLFGGSAQAYVAAVAAASTALEIGVPYSRYVRYLKWLCAALLAYILTALVAHVDWARMLRAALIPRVELNKDFATSLTAVLGTTISPYLLFWQASEEAEEVEVRSGAAPLRERPRQARRQLRRIAVDTRAGMVFSNVVAFSIIVTTAATLHAAGQTRIDSAAQAARALEPLAGRFAYLLFALGIVGTGLLAVPVLAGSAAYAIGEALNRRVGLERRPWEARAFYSVIAASTLIGGALNFAGVNPIRALFWCAVINGVVSVPVIAVTLRLACDRQVMREFALPRGLRALGWLTCALMACSALSMAVLSR